MYLPIPIAKPITTFLNLTSDQRRFDGDRQRTSFQIF